MSAASPLPRRPTGPLRIGEFEVQPASNELRGPAGTIRLRPLLMEVLLRLAAEPGAVVARERLIEDVWPRRMVNDEVLSRAIAELRTALGDDPRQPRYVETLPKAGYRLVAAVEPGGDGRSPARRRWLPALAASVVLGSAATVALLVTRTDPAAGLADQLAAAQPFTADLQLELGPRFSPDGSRVAFALGEGDEARVVVQPARGGARRLVGQAGAAHLSPVFFPDGRRLALWRGRGGECEIVEHDLDSGAERRLLDCELRPRPRFDLSPDGSRLVVSATAPGRVGLVIVDVASGARRALTTAKAGGDDDVDPRFSPDGARVAFFRGTASHRRLWTVAADDPAGARQASALEGLCYGAAWLGPRGPLLVASDWLGFRALTLLDLGTGEARLLGARGARYPDVSAAGDVAWESAVYRADLWLVDALQEGASPRLLWPSTRYTNMPAFSPDGARLAFVSNRDGFEALYVAPLSGEPARLPLPQAYRYIRPKWSPDGRSLYAVRIPVGRRPAAPQAVRIGLADARLEALEVLGAAVTAVIPSDDGRWLYAGVPEGEAMRILRAPADGSAPPERLPLPPVAEFHLGGANLVFTRPGERGATRCRLDGGACEPVAVALDDSLRFDWVVAGDALYYPTTAGGRRQLERFDLARGQVAWRRDFAPTATGLAVAASPDGSRLAVSRAEKPAIDLMIARAPRPFAGREE